MRSSKNKIIVASAGSRKTTSIVEEVLGLLGRKVLITTYTNENVAQINSYFIQKKGVLPPQLDLASWFSFLLRDGVRPYQNVLTTGGRIATISFDRLPSSVRFAPKVEVARYYLNSQRHIYSERTSEFVCQCNQLSARRVVKRLEQIYDFIFIDEFQDLAGYDLDFVEELLRSRISVTAVLDPRQTTYVTNNSKRNKQFKKNGIFDCITKWDSAGLVSVEYRNQCYRSNQAICDFADSLYPELPKTTSMNNTQTGHDGIFSVEKRRVLEYYHEHNPTVLRYSRATNTINFPATNIGVSKGKTCDRVLVFPTKIWKQYLENKNPDKISDRAKLYVAITRAKYSVAFVV